MNYEHRRTTMHVAARRLFCCALVAAGRDSRPCIGFGDMTKVSKNTKTATAETESPEKKGKKMREDVNRPVSKAELKEKRAQRRAKKEEKAKQLMKGG